MYDPWDEPEDGETSEEMLKVLEERRLAGEIESQRNLRAWNEEVEQPRRRRDGSPIGR